MNGLRRNDDAIIANAGSQNALLALQITVSVKGMFIVLLIMD
jgi:hypothetical protein